MRRKDSARVGWRNLGAAGLFMFGLLFATGEGNAMDDFAGYLASEEPIPFVQAVETLEPLPAEAAQTGTMAYPQGPDSRERIQAALDRVAALEPDEDGFRGAVFLSKGTYYVNGGLRVKSGVVLRGEGQRGFGTTLIFQHPKGAGITVGSAGGSESRMAVEGLSITSNYDTTERNGTDAGTLLVGVQVRNAENVWVRGIRVMHSARAAVSVEHSQRVTVRDSLFLEPFIGGGSDEPAFLHSADSHRILVYNCTFGEEISDREAERRFEQQLTDRLGKRQAALVLAETLSKASLPMKLMFPRPVVDGEMQGEPTPEQQAFEKADQRTWKTVMSDDGTSDWTEQWFLDGEGSTTVTNSPEGMELKALNDHMVLWTKESFEGDIKIAYEFTRTDVDGGGVCIIYIQATGRGDKGYETDIATWSDYREEPGMGKYFRNMHLYHVSYACGYVRGRRYRPDIRKMNTFSELTPEYLVDQEDFFEVGVPYRITIIKTDRQIRMKAVGMEKALYFMLDNEKWPEITGGRIGLRQMRSRWSRYKDFTVSVPAE